MKGEKYSVGVRRECQNQPDVHLYFTLKTAREDIARRLAEGQKILWLQNIDTGREHGF